MVSPAAEKKFTILKRKSDPKDDDSQQNSVTQPVSSTVEDISVKPLNSISEPRLDNSSKAQNTVSKSEQKRGTQQPEQIANKNSTEPQKSKKDKKDKKDKKEKKDKKDTDKQAQNQLNDKSTPTTANTNAKSNTNLNIATNVSVSTSASVSTVQNKGEKSQLLERKKNISDKICDFIYSGKYLSQKEFLYLRREREDICDKLEKLGINPQNQETISTTSNSAANTKPNESSVPSELSKITASDVTSVQKSNTAPKPENIDSKKSKIKNTPPPTIPVKKEQKEEGPEPEYEWSEEVREALFKVFKMSRFRHNQLRAINATLRGEDIFVLMPTGGGKSLCYQLPAIINSGKTKGVTIVVSPLLSLAQDQVHSLNSLGIQAYAINSESTVEEKISLFNDLKSSDPQIKLAYITPEMLNQSSGVQDLLKELYERKTLARFVIDEAHCVSQWGHDFRPDYKHIGFIKTLYPEVPIIALTATANDRVKEDVKKKLYISNCLTLTQSFNRKNLHYEVREKTDKTVVSDIYNYISENHPESCGIIYCQSRKACEELAEELSGEYNLQIEHYHAGLKWDDRQRIQRDWHNGVFKIIVATIAFGMGIDKPDVRFVIHHSLPHSIEEYYQETGRAGRDGIESECILYYNYSDKQKIERAIDDGRGSYDTIVHKKNNLNKVVQFCENLVDCKRDQILKYFGEKFDRVFCYQTCDNCITALNYKFVQKDVTATAKNITRIVKLTQKQNISMRILLLLIKGSANKELKQYNIVPPLLGCAKDLSVDDTKRLVHSLIMKKILIESSVYNRIGYASTYLFTGPSSKSLLNGDTHVSLPFKEPLIKPE